MVRPGGACRYFIGAALLAAVVIGCGDNEAAATTTTTSTTTTTTATAVGVSETSRVVYVLRPSDGVTVRYTILAPPDHELVERDGDKVHFREAWLHVGDWRRNIRGQSDSPFYMEGFDLDNELLDRSIVEAGTSSVTVLAAEDFVESVQSVTARDRTGEMVPIEREN